MNLQNLDSRITELNNKYSKAIGAREMLQTQHDEKSESLTETKANLIQWDLERILLGKVSETARARMKSHIEATVTAALESVLQRPMRFEVHLRDIGGSPAADWIVVKLDGDEEVVTDPEDGSGGGLLDVVSIALRMAVLELASPKHDGPLVLDEAGKHVSASHRPALAEFLKEYAMQSGRQVLLITHSDELAAVADVSYRTRLVDGITEVSVA